MTAPDTDDPIEYVDRGLRFVVPAGVAIAVGMVGIVVAGLGLRIEGLAATSLMQLLLIAVLLWPVYRLAPWRPGVTERVRGWFRSNRSPVAVAAVLILGSRLPFAPDLFAALVDVPLVRTSGFFYGVEVFYRPHVGFEFGKVIRRFGQWYVTVFFVLGVVVLVIDIGKSIRSVVGGIR